MGIQNRFRIDKTENTSRRWDLKCNGEEIFQEE